MTKSISRFFRRPLDRHWANNRARALSTYSAIQQKGNVYAKVCRKSRQDFLWQSSPSSRQGHIFLSVASNCFDIGNNNGKEKPTRKVCPDNVSTFARPCVASLQSSSCNKRILWSVPASTTHDQHSL